VTRALAIALVLAPAVAHADKDDPPPDKRAVRMASEANLEPTRMREGLAFGINLGTSMQGSFGVDNASGTGGSIDLRIGTSASDRLSWFVDAFFTGTTAADQASKLESCGLLGGGLQIYALDSVWLRAGAGYSTLAHDKTTVAKGFGAFGGGGYDFVRRGGFGFSGEASVVTGLFRDGVVIAVVLGVGATWW
jgi:hypothetical protein